MRKAIAWLLVTACAAWVLVRLLGLERGFPLVPLVAFTPVAALAVLLVVGVAVVLGQRTAAVAAAVLAVALAAVVAPRAVGGPSGADGPDGPHLRVLTANMQLGGGSPEQLVALVRRTRADVLSVQELGPELVARLDAAGLHELLPERVLAPLPGGTGVGLFARVPLRARPAPRGTTNPVAIAAARVDGAPQVELVAVHPQPPLRPALIEQWRADLRALPPASPDGPLRILAGDFNATLDHEELRRILATGYEDAAAQVGAGLHGTWPEGSRFPPPIAIDHVLADSRAGVHAVSLHTIANTDHRAVFAELVLPRER
jgi:endonuclease/exonuclease/phosphatase (EEP) superfamily protein YafD